jgi:hypothetical protein
LGGTTWKTLGTKLLETLQETLQISPPKTQKQFIELTLRQVIQNGILSLFTEYSTVFDPSAIPWEHQDLIDKIKRQIKQTNLYNIVTQIIQQLKIELIQSPHSDVKPEIATLILLAYTNQLLSPQMNDSVKQQLQVLLQPDVVSSELKEEIQTLSEEISNVQLLCCCSARENQYSEESLHHCCKKIKK